MPKNLNNAKITQRLVEAFQLKGRYIPMLDEVIVPTYVIDDPAPAEPNRLCAGTVRRDGVSAPLIIIHNPVGSQILVVLTSVIAEASKLVAAGQAQLFLITGSLIGANIFNDNSDNNSKAFRDTRITLAGPQAALLADAGGSGGVQIFERSVLVSDTTEPLLFDMVSSPVQGPRQPPIVLAPNTGLAININVGVEQISLAANFLWEEIPLLGSIQRGSGTPP